MLAGIDDGAWHPSHVQCGGYYVATCGSYSTNRDADAAFIAAAPRLIRGLLALLAALRDELAQWKTWGIIEIAIRNPNVASYMDHWESRALKAEALLAASARQPQEVNTDLLAALKGLIEASMLPVECAHGESPDYCDKCRYAMEKAAQMARIHARAVIATEAASAREQGWREIESAPKDGTWILAGASNRRRPVIAVWESDDWLDDVLRRLDFRPTLWQPLPPPPRGDETP